MKRIIDGKQELFNECLEQIRKDIVNQQSALLKAKKNRKQQQRTEKLMTELDDLQKLKKYFKKCYPLAGHYWENKVNSAKFERKFTRKI